MTRTTVFGTGALALLLATTHVAALDRSATVQTPQSGTPSTTAPKPDPDDGIPVTNQTVINTCGSCHTLDSKQRLSRISYRRTTPEGWQETIRRMVSLNKAEIDPAAAREVVRYLSDHHGLAPEEVAPATFELERRLIDFKYTASADTEQVCAACHSMGRVMLQRRSAQEWNLVVAMHRGFYPLVDFQSFRRGGPASSQPGADGRPPDNRHPYEKAVAHLRSAYPLTTQAWTEWSATMRSPRLAGTWALTGYEPGAGPVYGQVTMIAGATPDEFTTRATYSYPKTGRTVVREGRSVIYTGFQWRGRTTIGQNDATSLREVMQVDRSWQTLTGRWFTGAHDELGLDVKLARVERDVLIQGLDRVSLPKSATPAQLRVYGANLPASAAPGDLDFGRGVRVTRVVAATPTLLTVEVAVDDSAPVGVRDLVVAGAVGPKMLTIYDKVDYIKVTPAWNMSRLGGVVFPKMTSQFEAMAYSRGADGKPDTADDLQLGAVDATWTVEEYTATFDDDDIKFVGEIDARTGAFTPALDGPNPQRSGNRNNVGDVWVVGTHTPGSGGAPLRARSHLVVTVPLYMRWDLFTMGGL